jgi:TolB protein
MDRGRGSAKRPMRLFFTTQGRTALINANRSGLRYLDFEVPDQVTWQPGPFL